MFLRNHDTTALKWQGKEISYADLLSRVSACAALFAEDAGRVVIFSENRPEWIAAFYGAWKNNCTVIPVDYLSTVEEVSYIVQDSRPRVCFCSREREPVMRRVAESLEYSLQILVFEDFAADWDELDWSNSPGSDLAAPVLTDTALIIYTSGTTGDPKGVMLSYDNILANVEAVSVGVPIYSRAERVMLLLPLHHIFPLLGSMVAPLSVGALVAIAPSLQSADIIHTLQSNRITIIIGVPRLYQLICRGIMDKIQQKKIARLLFLLAEKIGSQRLSSILFKTVHQKFGGSLKYLVCGGAALDIETGRNFTTLGFEILEGFGMTEAAPMITFTRPGQVVIGSAGTAMSCTEIEIRDGEIVASGRNIMQGYLNRPEETEEVLQDGWLYTGDLGRIDDQGRIFITGRRKEIIVLASGKNINPVLIEQKLEQLSDCINEVGVFVKDDVLQAVIRPDLVKIREQGIQDMEEYFRWQVLDHYNTTVSPAKRVLQFTLIDEELPRTRLSKLRRFQLPELVGSRQIRKDGAEQPDFEEYQIIKDFIEQQTGRAIRADDHLEIDLALDSLDQVSLLAFVKSSFGIALSEEQLMPLQSVRRLAEFVRKNKKKIQIETINWQKILTEPVALDLPRTWLTVNLFTNCSRLFFALYFRFRGIGQNRLPNSPCIIAPNHQSFFDAMFVACLLDNRFMNRTYFYAKEKHVRKPLLRFLANRNNVIVVDVNSGLRESIQKLAAVLQQGKNIIIFPEGTRSRDGRPGRFKKLFAILSVELGVPVIPVTIDGAFQALPPGSLLPKPLQEITVTFHDPLLPTGHDYDSLTSQVFQEVTKELQVE